LIALCERRRPHILWREAPDGAVEDSPYKGLQVFDVADAPLFFGRDALTRQLIERLHETRFLMIVGASGSGKSSLVRAGVVATLLGKRPAPPGVALLGGISEGDTFILTPTDRPLRELATHLTRGDESVRAVKTLIEDLRADADSLDLFVGKRLADDKSARALIVVDQFEELFTACKDEVEQRAFIENLRRAADDAHNGQTIVVITLRADFYEKCAPFDAFYTALPAHQVNVPAMQPDELQAAIEAPARLSGLTLEPALTDALLRDIGHEPGALPLLSHALLETWKRREGNTLTVRGYAEAGGLDGAIAATAKREYDALSPEEQAIARRMFVALTELNTDAPDTRRRVKLAALLGDAAQAQQAEAVLHNFVRARLVTGGAGQTYEVAHEAVIRNWPQLAGWLQEDRADKLLARQIERDAARWQERGGDASDLYRGLRLREAAGWLQAQRAEATPLQSEFIRAAQAEEARQAGQLQDLERRAAGARRLTGVLGVAAGLILLLVAGALLALQRVTSDISQARLEGTRVALNVIETNAKFRADQAWRESRDGKARNAFILALEAMKDYPSLYTHEGNLALNEAVAYPWRETVLQNDSSVYGAAWNAAGTQVLGWSADNTVRIWDAASGRQVFSLQHDGRVYGAAWSKDGTRVLSWSADDTARMWDAASGKQVFSLQHDGRVYGAAWNTAGTQMLGWSADNTVRVWDAESGQQVFSLQHDGRVNGVAWSKDETQVLTWSDDGTAQVWGAATGRQVLSLQHNGSVNGAAWSKDETQVLTWSDDGTAQVWGAATGRQVFSLQHDGRVNGAAWSKDETQVLTWSSDYTARVSDAGTGRQVFSLQHGSGVYDAAWNTAGTQVLTWSDDGTAQVWDAATGRQVFSLQHGSGVYDAAWNTAGTQVLSWSADNTVRIWNAATGRQVFSLRHDSSVNGAAWNAAGTQMLSWSADNTVRAWDAATGRQAFSLQHDSSVYGAVWNAAETQVLSWSADNTVRAWDAATGRQVFSLQHDGRVYGAAWNRDETRVLSWSGDGTARVWDAGASRQVFSLQHDSGVNGAAWNRDGTQVLSWSANDTARMWDAASGKQVFSLQHDGSVYGAAWSKDGTRVLSWSADDTARMWDAASGKQVFSLRHDDIVNGAAWSKDGTQVLSWSDDNTIRIWDAATGKQEFSLQHNGSVNGAAWNAAGTQVLSWSDDDTVRIWDAGSGRQVFSLQHDGSLFGAAWNRDGTRVLTWLADGTARITDTSIERSLAYARAWVARASTMPEAERKRLGLPTATPGPTPQPTLAAP
jgi:WD40 repeat protein